MEIPSSASYELDNGTISICRHFGAGEKPAELLSSAVAQPGQTFDIARPRWYNRTEVQRAGQTDKEV